jgi:hypothetical protein
LGRILERLEGFAEISRARIREEQDVAFFDLD